MENDQEILAQANDSIQQQRAALLSAGEGRQGGEPKRLSFAERLAKLDPQPEATPDQLAERERIDAQMAAQKQAREADERAMAIVAQIGRRYADVSLTNFQPPCPAAVEVLAKVQAYVDNLRENIATGAGLVLLGPPGTGKDHLIVAVLKQAAREGFKARWVDGLEMFASARDNIDGNDTEDRWTRQFTDPDILAISDPIPPVGEVKEGFQIGTLFRIINRRYRDGRPTMITINVADAKEASSKMSLNIVDRLSHGSLVLKCSWASYRKPMA